MPEEHTDERQTFARHDRLSCGGVAQVEQALETFERAIRERPEVMECYLMTGDADYLLRVVVSDLTAYERFLKEHLTRVAGVASIKSSFALNQVKYATALPLAGV